MADHSSTNDNLHTIGLRLKAALAELGFLSPCLSVSVHDTDLDPLVAEVRAPVYVVGVGAAAPVSVVNEALAQSEDNK